MTLTVQGSGPWKGVVSTNDPYEDRPDVLDDAVNLYIPDPAQGSGAYARPGFVISTPTYSITAGQASCLYTMTALDGTIYRFFMTNGKLYRLSGTGYTTSTDVTPVGVTISNSATPTARFYMTSFADELIATDGVNRPWRGTNLSATPITGTYIDIDGAAGSWTAQGAPVVYSGALYFIAKTVPGGSSVEAGVGLVWSEPFQPDVGYVQTGYANFWNLIEQSAEPLYALWATNNYLYYFRERSIGALTGAPGANFATSASADMVSGSVGTKAPASVCQFADTIYFVDSIGRPHAFSGTGPVQELWKQLRGVIDTTPALIASPTATALCGIGAIVPQLNVVLLGGWSSNASNSPPLGPTTLYAFDAVTGIYFGRWIAGTASGLTTFDSLAQMKDSTGAPVLAAFSTGGATQSVFLMSLLSAANWKDNTVVPTRSITIPRLGYSANVVWNATDVGTIIQQGTHPLTVTVQTPYTSSTTECTAMSPPTSSDGTNRVLFGMDVLQARGIQVTATPTTATAQWIVQRVEFVADSSRAGVEDR
jgi:hypothetical protein